MIWIITYLIIIVAIVSFNHARVKGRQREAIFYESLNELDAFFKENPYFLLDDGDEELGWYEWCEENLCELCDDLVIEDEAFAIINADEDDGMLFICEYCLNPKLN